MLTMLNKIHCRPLLALVVSSLLLSACDEGSDSSNATTVTGSLTTPRITNLAYQGSQGSNGRTNAAGEFMCKSGETLSFTLGKTVLGTATCQADSTSLMQMVGGGLTTQNALQEMQRAGGTLEVLPYDQWINRLRLLAELDSNSNLSDGIQLPTGLDSLDAFKTTAVDFNKDYSLFGPQIVQVFYPAVAARLLQHPLWDFWEGDLISGLEAESAGALKFPAYVPVSKTSTDTAATTGTYVWNEQGLVTHVNRPAGVANYSYDEQGRIVLQTSPLTDGGKLEKHYVLTPQNRVRSRVDTQYDAAGAKSKVSTYDFIYDANGYLTQWSDAETVVNTKTITRDRGDVSYTANGQDQQILKTTSVEVNGVVDQTKTRHHTLDYTYDAKGNQLTYTEQVTDAAGAFISKTLTKQTYNSLNLVVDRTYQVLDSNGTIKASNQLNNTYTAEGYLSGTTRSYQEGNQTIGHYKDVYQYGLNGRLLRKVRTHYHPDYGNGTQPVRMFELTLSYNEAGLRTRSEEKTTQYQDGLGQALAPPTVNTTIKTWDYDAQHNPISVQSDANGDGVAEAKGQWTWQAVASIGSPELIESHKVETLAASYSINLASEDGSELSLTPSLRSGFCLRWIDCGSDSYESGHYESDSYSYEYESNSYGCSYGFGFGCDANNTTGDSRPDTVDDTPFQFIGPSGELCSSSYLGISCPAVLF